MMFWIWIIIAVLVVLALTLLKIFVINGRKANNKKNMTDKLAIVTGANAGIGIETVLDLLDNGCEVIFACRNREKAQDEIDKIDDEGKRKRCHFIRIDLSEFSTVDTFCQEFKEKFPNRKIDLLINNAGLLQTSFSYSKNWIENVFQSNHLSHLILTLKLLEFIDEEQGKIINVSSAAYKMASKDLIKSFLNDADYTKLKENYKSWDVYAFSKISNIYFSKHLSNYLQTINNKVKVNSLHPGVVRTNFSDNVTKNKFFCFVFYAFYPILWYLTRPRSEGAQTTLQVAYSNNQELVGGDFYDNCKPKELEENAKDQYLMSSVMKFSLDQIEKSGYLANDENLKKYFEYIRNN